VFPPDVLELLVKFQCTSCGSALYADARYEGREVVCTSCSARTGIPRWSNVPNWPRFSEAGQITRMRTSGASAAAKAPTLSVDEIEFLRGTESRKPEAVV
jgi:DNA-directed RNA polymerase subunit RPC12/RpoP